MSVESVVEASEVSIDFNLVSVEPNDGVSLRSSIVPVEFHVSISSILLRESNG